MPSAIQIQTLILVDIAVAYIHTRGVHAQEHPRGIGAAGAFLMRATTGAPLVPRCILASVRKYPCP